MNKKWEIQYKNQEARIKNSPFAKASGDRQELIDILLNNRGITTKEQKEAFLHPNLQDVTIQSVGIDKKEVTKAIKRIQKAIKEKEHIVVFGDYDVDGITASAILWETLYALGAHTSPYIPHRIDEGYGLSAKGIENILKEKENVKLIITVDNGIVAKSAVDFANEQGIDVIITDHHMPEGEEKDMRPNAHAIVHTTALCGAGVAWLFSQELRIKNHESKENRDHLAFAALGTVADLVPLTNANRAIVTEGLKALRNTRRPGLLALFQEARIQPHVISTYEIGHIIAPRLNAMGRLESAMDSLRLLCTPNPQRSHELAQKLSMTNRERQERTKVAIEHARQLVLSKNGTMGKLLFIAHESYEQGIIGLIAGRLVEEFYRPAIVLSKGDLHTKASARSVHGFNIVEFIRFANEYLVDVGGHPMAAGFTVETAKLELLQQMLEELAGQHVTDDHLLRLLKIDMEIPLSAITEELYNSLMQLAPFGMGNPQPVFVSRNVTVEDMRLVGADRRHLKLHVFQDAMSAGKRSSNGSPSPQSSPTRGEEDQGRAFLTKSSVVLEAIGFGLGEKADNITIGEKIDIAYTIDENEWNGQKSLQLKLKDIQVR